MVKTNLFIIGTPKAATTTLHEILASHPNIEMSSNKEPHFFSEIGRSNPTVTSIKSLENYNKLFSKNSKAKFFGESSVSYMHDPFALYKIHKNTDQPKIIIMLREPISRMYSHWLMDRRDGIQKLPFIEAVENDYKKSQKGFGVSNMYVECSLYSESILLARSLFGEHNVYIGFYEDFISDTSYFMHTLANWLNINQDFNITSRKSNQASLPRNNFYAMIFQNNTIRFLSKILFPDKIKPYLRNFLLKPVENNKPESVFWKVFSPLFENDIRNLKEIKDWDYSKWKKS